MCDEMVMRKETGVQSAKCMGSEKCMRKEKRMQGAKYMWRCRMQGI